MSLREGLIPELRDLSDGVVKLAFFAGGPCKRVEAVFGTCRSDRMEGHRDRSCFHLSSLRDPSVSSVPYSQRGHVSVMASEGRGGKIGSHRLPRSGGPIINEL